MNGNKGLSVAYNKAIYHLKKNKVKYLIIADSDTFFPNNYLDILNDNLDESDIYVPKVISKHNKMFYSPINAKTPLINILKRILKKDIIFEKITSITAINSGITVKMDIFDNYKYDEKVFLYFVDLIFFEEMNRQKKKIKIIDIVLEQEFSEFASKFTKASYTSMEMRLRDAKIYYDKKYILYKIAFISSKVISYRSIIPLKLLFKKVGKNE